MPRDVEIEPLRVGASRALEPSAFTKKIDSMAYCTEQTKKKALTLPLTLALAPVQKYMAYVL